jgi:broad specificity phosphatase PhoE
VSSEIWLVRHGQTEWSENGRHTSRTDLGLIESGRSRAAEIGSELRGRAFAAVLCSPLRRARETCEIAGFGDAAQLDEDLREWDYGSYEGMTTPEIRAQRPDWDLWRDGCPGGETPEQVCERADRVLARLRPVVSADLSGEDRADRSAERNGGALVFAHGHILRVITARWLGLAVEKGARFALAAGRIGVLGYERETEVLKGWGR